MEHSAGIDVSLESSSVCVVDAKGQVLREAKIASEPEALVGWFNQLGAELARVGLEAGPLSQWHCHVNIGLAAWNQSDDVAPIMRRTGQQFSCCQILNASVRAVR